MDKPVENYWKLRLDAMQDILEANNFEVHLARDETDAGRIVLENILPSAKPGTVSFGGSMTLAATGLPEALRERDDVRVIDTFDKSVSPEEGLERRREALTCDLFLTGTNAVTMGGRLVNLDMYGNRVAPIAFGPKHVVVLVGRNKICPDLEEAMFRIKNYAAPTNTMRLDKKTPCAKTSVCEECKSKDRICNVWTITEKSFPKGRIKVVLIDKDLGL